MKLGKKYVAAIVALTAAAVAGVYMLEDHNQRWVLAHPVLDGAIGSAVIIPITGVIALAVIDRRLDVLARSEKNAQAELVMDRLESALRQSIRAALYGVSTDNSRQVEAMDADELRRLAKGLQTLAQMPTQSELKHIDELLTMYVRRAVGLMDQLVALTSNERARLFAAYITDGLDFVLLGPRLPSGIGPAPERFWRVYASLAEMLVNATDQLCPAALPLGPMARAESHGAESLHS